MELLEWGTTSASRRWLVGDDPLTRMLIRRSPAVRRATWAATLSAYSAFCVLVGRLARPPTARTEPRVICGPDPDPHDRREFAGACCPQPGLHCVRGDHGLTQSTYYRDWYNAVLAMGNMRDFVLDSRNDAAPVTLERELEALVVDPALGDDLCWCGWEYIGRGWSYEALTPSYDELARLRAPL